MGIIKTAMILAMLVISGATMAQRNEPPVTPIPVTEPGVTVNGSVFGGGNLAKVHGNTLVTVDQNTAVVVQDVYGGGALAEVGTNASNTTTVNILDGTIQRAVYGGGLGRKYAAATTDPDTGEPIPEVTAVEAKVNGVVTVNIGTSLGENGGSATLIGANVFGGNNTNGSPQDDVTVHIWKTAHTTENSVPGTTFAIKDVFGGGNEADYIPAVENKQCLVWVHGCENTIERTFGGGNAADAGTADDQGHITLNTNVETHIEGGRIDKVFGGGNGELGPQYAADINGDLALQIDGGYVGQFYGASNENGTIRGNLSVDVASDGSCGELTINELFSGSNAAAIAGDLVTNIQCSPNATGDLTINNLYGGCNQADIGGSVVLNVHGGHYINVYGGSCGTSTKPADIGGNVTLNLYGGTIENAYGGCNVNGNVSGLITVNVIDDEGDCPLYVTNVYGGSNLADYTPRFTPASGSDRIAPVVNIVHAKNGISGNVYGGSRGLEGASDEDATVVQAHPLVNVGYDQDMNGYITPTSDYIDEHSTLLASPRAIIAGSVFGGGDAAKVVGNTMIMLRNRAKVFGNVYGGGNMGVVTGDTKVIVNGADH